MTQKRPGGMITGDKWLVLTESKWSKVTLGWKHSCDADLIGREVAHPVVDDSGEWISEDVRIRMAPFCPSCEMPPDYKGIPITQEMAEKIDAGKL